MMTLKNSRNNFMNFVLLICLSLMWSTSHAALPEGISVTVTPATQSYKSLGAVLLEISYENVTTEPIKLLKWGTALEGRLNRDALSVIFEESELPYIGRVYKRGQASDDDFVIIEAGQSVSGEINIQESYPVEYQGDYSLTHRDALLVQLEDGSYAQAKKVSFKLANDIPLAKRTPNYQSCTGPEQSLIDSALGVAEGYARLSRDDMAATAIADRPQAQRYAEWFGAYHPSRWDHVQNNYNKIYSTLASTTITFDCSCNDNSFAYVFPSQPYDVYLCNVFWLVPTGGTDSKAGTIIHEVSHFNVVAGTDDHVYGQPGARNLANTNPNLAVNNADSTEYFSENTPFLSMPDPEPITPVPPEPEPEPDPITAFLGALMLLLLGD